MRYVNFERLLKWPLEVPYTWSRSYVILASFPKSGNTWFRFVVANLLSESLSNEQIDFRTIEKYSPVIKKDRFIKRCFNSPNMPLFLKTHFYYNVVFSLFDAVVIYREPEDVFRSFYYYVNSEHGKSFDSLMELVDSPRLGIDYWNYFYRSWLNKKNCIFVSYDDLVKKPLEGFSKIFNSLNYSISEQALNSAISKSSKSEMMRLEEEFGDPNKRDPNYGFVGKNKQRDYSGDDLLAVRAKLSIELKAVFSKLERRKILF